MSWWIHQNTSRTRNVACGRILLALSLFVVAGCGKSSEQEGSTGEPSGRKPGASSAVADVPAKKAASATVADQPQPGVEEQAEAPAPVAPQTSALGVEVHTIEPEQVALVADARGVLDLRDLPRYADAAAEVLEYCRLNYEAPGTPAEVKEFYDKLLRQEGWSELEVPPLPVDDPPVVFTKAGYYLQLVFSASSRKPGTASVWLINHGNVDTQKLPRPADAEIERVFGPAVFYTTASGVPEAAAFCREVFSRLGWLEYREDESSPPSEEHESLYFKCNGVSVLAGITPDVRQPGKTSVCYTPSMLINGFPALDDARDLVFSDRIGTMRYKTPRPLAEVVELYEGAAEGLDWTRKAEVGEVGDGGAQLFFDHPQGHVLALNVLPDADGGSWVALGRISAEDFDASRAAPAEAIAGAKAPASDQPADEPLPAAPEDAADAPGQEMTPGGPSATVAGSPGAPATLAEAARVLDLRTFPMMEGGQLKGMRLLAELSYEVEGSVKPVFAFQRENLTAGGWKELPDSNVSDDAASAVFTKAGFTIQVSVSTYIAQKEGSVRVMIKNRGNVDLEKLPVPAGLTPSFSFPIQLSYTTEADTAATAQECRQLLLAQGWTPYGSAGDTVYFKQNAVQLSARVSAHEAQPGKTFINYSTELLSADIPVPADADKPEYIDGMKTLSFGYSPEKLHEVVTFYDKELASGGFKSTGEAVGVDNVTTLVFLNQANEAITLEMTIWDEARIKVSHRTAAQIAEIGRQHVDETAPPEEDPGMPSEMPALAVPVPSNAQETPQGDEESLGMTVASGTGQAIFEAYRKHFKSIGWKEEDAEIEAAFGNLHFSKDDSEVVLSFVDAGLSDDLNIMIMGMGISLEVAAEPLALSGAVGATEMPQPPPPAEVAKIPADLPIPANAHELIVRSGKNVAYDVNAEVGELADYLRQTMERHGWTYDEDFSSVDSDGALLSFKKGKAPCGISLSKFSDEAATSVTIAGGGIKWDELRENGEMTDPAVVTAPRVASSSGAADDASQDMPAVEPEDGILATTIPLPEGAKDVEREADIEMIIFRSDLGVKAVVEFYREQLGKLGWEEDEEQTFVDEELGAGVTFAKGDEDFRIAVQDGQPDSRTRMIIQGEGIVWPGGGGDVDWAEPPPSVDGELALNEDHGLPLPEGCYEATGQGGPYRQYVTAKIRVDLAKVLEFYRRELPDLGWKEDKQATKVEKETAQLSFSGPRGPLSLKIYRKRKDTAIEVGLSNTELAKKHGIVPKPGKARLMLGNAHQKDVVITVDNDKHRVGAGVGAKDPGQAIKVDLEPGKHSVTIEIPGEDPQTEEIAVEADTAWGVFVIPTGGYFVDRVY